MTLTGLEAVLVGIVVAAIASLVTHYATARVYQTRTACDERHKQVCADMCEVKATAKADRDKVASDQSLILRMLRAAIMHLPIDDRVKTSIINDKAE